MYILVINSGSSSLKFQLIKSDKTLTRLAKGMIDGIGLSRCQVTFTNGELQISKKTPVKTHQKALHLALELLKNTGTITDLKEISAIGHRVVHGGEKYTKPIKINAQVMQAIKKLSSLAPLHNPANLAGIIACKKALPRVPQVAVFDTAFHQSMPEKAFLYALPYQYYKKDGIRRYGFHGSSHKYVTNAALKLLKTRRARTISCHLGNGSSITACLNGKSIDTSMGFTPLEGIPMGTRSGSIDPAIAIQLTKQLGANKTNELLNKKSGLLGLSGISNDMRDIRGKAKQGHKRAQLTIDHLSYQIAKYCGAYAAALNGLNALIFTGGLGEKAFYVRKQVCRQLEFLGLQINPAKNRKNELQIHASNSKVKVFIIPTDEEKQIAMETMQVLQ